MKDILLEWKKYLVEEGDPTLPSTDVPITDTSSVIPQQDEDKKQADAKLKITALTTALDAIQKQAVELQALLAEEKKKKSGDRCTRIAKRKYKVWPSAYASGAVVKCRQGKIWKGISESATDEEIDEALLLEEQIEEAKKRDYKPNFSKEKEQGLHGWFARNKGKGWINCRTGGPCGRSDADKGGKYPACRPTKAQCKSAGKGPLRRKKSSKPISWTKKKKKD